MATNPQVAKEETISQVCTRPQSTIPSPGVPTQPTSNPRDGRLPLCSKQNLQVHKGIGNPQ
ncbi:hypothetical protein I79_004926 [Cricetulus griseus]|uniref:Uncharacterized protein n=1 Tax=Cricetulus griseus TaxID=10029 RepID=G3H3T9_CRIGR|nr:hypothetical protein I79_004926 [Cricetulus griseus]